VEEDELVRRLSGRRVLVDGEWIQRDDDRPETVRHRLQVYREQTAPLSGWYDTEGLLTRIDAIGAVEEVTERAMDALAACGGTRPDGSDAG
jgi:adenylate kinase